VVGQGGGLVKHIQVADGKLLSHTFIDFQYHALVSGATLIATKFNGAGTSFGVHWELAEVRVSRNGERLVQGVEFLANLGELAGVNRNTRRVLSFGDGEVLNIEGDQVKGELSSTLLLGVLKNEFQVGCVVLSLKSNAVAGVRKLHHLGEEPHIDT
jgi:hypothetical protein